MSFHFLVKNAEQLEAEKTAEAVHYGNVCLGLASWPTALPPMPDHVRSEIRPHVEKLVKDLQEGRFTDHYEMIPGRTPTMGGYCICPKSGAEGAFIVEQLKECALLVEGKIQRSVFLETVAQVFGEGRDNG